MASPVDNLFNLAKDISQYFLVDSRHVHDCIEIYIFVPVIRVYLAFFSDIIELIMKFLK